jgi:hypothetical protein
MLKKHFPDWEERINYQKKQEKNYLSALNRIAEANRLRVKLKLTSQEQDALDYFQRRKILQLSSKFRNST